MADTSAFNIQGPVKVYVQGAIETGAFTASDANHLGWTSNDDMISVNIENLLQPHYSSERGQMPAAMIYQGVQATINMTLVKWNQSVKDTITNSIWQNSTGDTHGSVGQDILNRAFSYVENLHVKLVPTGQAISGSDVTTYWFKKCYLESLSETEWGNAPKKLVLSIKAIPSSGNVLYARS